MAEARRRLVVVYDRGAAGAVELVTSLRPVAELRFLLADSAQAQAAGRVLGALKVDTAPLDGDLPDADGVVTFSDRMVRATAAMAERLGRPGHTPATAAALTDKARQRAVLAEAGVDDVPSIEVAGLAEATAAVGRIGVPVVVKPVRGEGSGATYPVRGLADLPAVFAAAAAEYGAAGPFVVERLLVGVDHGPLGDYVSVELVASGGTITVAGVTGKLPLLPPFRECANLRPHGVPLAEADAAADLAVRAARALGVTDGVLHAEVKLTADGPHIIEVNGRLGGFIAEITRRATGLDLIATAGRVALGEPVEVAYEEPDRVMFQWFDNPPLGANRLLAVTGAQRVKAHPAVASYTTLVPARSACDPGVGTQLLDLVCGSAASHAELPGLLTEILAELSFTFALAGGESLTLRGDELRRRNLAAAEPVGAGR